MSTSGQTAEAAAADYLQEQGYKILARNWRNRFCEIDIVAQKGSAVHFVEVKFRINEAQGAAVDYVTTNKLDRMTRAAAAWCQAEEYEGDYQLDVVAIDGERLRLLENVTC